MKRSCGIINRDQEEAGVSFQDVSFLSGTKACALLQDVPFLSGMQSE